jgi:hypothetical protein
MTQPPPGPPGPHGSGPQGPPGGYGPQGPYGPPGPRPARFPKRYVALGVVLAVVEMFGLPVLLLRFASDRLGAALLATAVALLAPLLVGVLLVLPGSPVRRAIGLGLIIGWGAALVIAGGLCVALLAGLPTG